LRSSECASIFLPLAASLYIHVENRSVGVTAYDMSVPMYAHAPKSRSDSRLETMAVNSIPTTYPKA